MQARIYQFTKSAMQSGQSKNDWILEFIPYLEQRNIDSVMGWSASDNILDEVKLKFASSDEAIKYAETNLIEYELLTNHKRSIIKKNYSDNFMR